jgi:DNA helicase II / ATP-dependent DNA helicase PcrA
MKERIEKVVGSGAQRVWAGTFHSLFARILRVEAHKIGYPNDFTIYDTDDSKSLIKEILKSLRLDVKVYNVGAVRSRISMAKSNLISPKAYANNEDLMAHDNMNRRPMMFKIYEEYVKKCKRAGAMDFDDLLLQMFTLLYKNPEGVRQKYQSQFQYVMVDEFQDTNSLQYEIMKLLVVYPDSPNNICIVGDDAQSIYSFRGATIENILQFQADFDQVQVFKLEQNYRSTNYIVDAANEVINNNTRQIQKKIWTEKQGGKKIKIIKAMTDNEEGKRIADTIIEQKNRNNYRNSEIAILYRTNAQSRVFEEHLRRFNLPYRIYGGLSFYQRKEIKDVLAYMRLCVNSKDDEALKRIINYPKRGIGNTTMDKLTLVANENEISIWQVITQITLSGANQRTIGGFIQNVRKMQQQVQAENAYRAALYIVKESGIIDLLKADTSPEGKSRIENITALLDGIQEFVEDDEISEGEEAPNDKSLARFLQSISLMTDADQDTESVDTITMMSVHSAKGLEYKSVFVVGLEENLFPSFMSLSLPEQIEEERRLFYVAITRAEEMLTLSFANSRYQFGNMRFNDVSRFLEEIPESMTDSLVLQTKKEFGEPKILGNFKKVGPATKALPQVDSSTFKASPMSAIKVGKKILHLKFGQGTVLEIDERHVATIRFDHIYDNPDKRIMLQYAKLQVLED